MFPTEHVPSSVKRPAPDCEYIYNQLRTFQKFNLTLSQLWIEYKAKYPDGYQYTQFCEYYCRWRKKLDYCMRQEHRGGEKLFIDYSDGLSIVDTATGELTLTQLFVAVWGASNYTYAEAYDVTNVTGMDQFAQSCASILRVCTSRYGAR